MDGHHGTGHRQGDVIHGGGADGHLHEIIKDEVPRADLVDTLEVFRQDAAGGISQGRDDIRMGEAVRLF